MTKKVKQYFVARKSGKNKTESALVAGYADASHISQIENTKEFKNLERRYSNVLQEKITIDEIAEKHAELIRQPDDKSVSLGAIKLAKETIEPDSNPPD